MPQTLETQCRIPTNSYFDFVRTYNGSLATTG